MLRHAAEGELQRVQNRLQHMGEQFAETGAISGRSPTQLLVEISDNFTICDVSDHPGHPGDLVAQPKTLAVRSVSLANISFECSLGQLPDQSRTSGPTSWARRLHFSPTHGPQASD